MFKLFSVEVIPSSIVHPLSEQLNGGLGSIFLFLWHVQIIDKDNDLIFALLWPKEAFSSSCTHLGVNEPLDLIRDSLSRKSCRQEGILLIVVTSIKLVSNVDRFTSTSGTAEENMHVIFNIQV